MNHRSNAPRWRHDAYTLRALARAIQQCVCLARENHHLGAGRTIVDLGCGDAPYRSLLTSDGSRYIGCDLQPGPHVDLTFESGRIPLPAGSADCVTSFQVLEHVWDLDGYLGECKRLLGPDGLLILSTHGTWLYHPHPGDFRRWTLDGLKKELSSRGFDITHTYPVVGPLAWTTQFRTFAYHHVLTRLGLIGRTLSQAFCLLMYFRMKFEDKITPNDLIRDNAAIHVILARPTA